MRHSLFAAAAAGPVARLDSRRPTVSPAVGKRGGLAGLALLGLTLAASASGVAADPTRPLWSTLEPGPYAVGFTVQHNYDDRRGYRAKIDYRGERTTGDRGRPIQVSLWYPADPQAAKQSMTVSFGDYIDLIASETTFDATNQTAKNAARAAFLAPSLRVGEVAQADLDRLLASATPARRDAPAARGRFPYVLLAQGFGVSSYYHSTLAELLASHGFVVITSPSTGRWARPMIGGQLGLETQVGDLEYLAELAQGLPYVDAERNLCIGFSFGGGSCLLYAARNQSVDGLLSLDGAEGLTIQANEIRANPGWDAKAVRVPLLYLAAGAPNARDWALVDSLWASERFTVTFHDLRHHDVSTMAILEAKVPGMSNHLEGEAQTDTEVGFVGVHRYALAFAQAILLQDQAARDFLMRAPDANQLPADFADLDHRAAERPLPTTQEVLGLVRSPGGVAQATELFREVRSRHPGLALWDENTLNLLGYELLGGGRVEEAIAVQALNAEAFPSSANVFDSLGEALLAAGRKQEALASYRRALETLAKDTTTPPNLRDAIQQAGARTVARLEQELAAE